MDNSEILYVYEFLEKCVNDKNSGEWNTYRRKNRKLEISLNGLKFQKWDVDSFNFKGITFQGADFSESTFSNCMFDQCRMDELQAFGVTFTNCSFVSTNLQNGNYVTSVFRDCDMRYADFSKGRIHQSKMESCKAENGFFKNMSIYDTSLGGSVFANADFSSTEIRNVDIYGSNFTAITVDGATVIWDCYYDRDTNFTGVGLNSCRVEPVLMSSFQCNIRRIWWKDWYADKLDTTHEYFKEFVNHPLKRLGRMLVGIGFFIMTWVVKLFWWITDYGSSTIRLILVFIATATFFATMYTVFPHITNDAILNYSNDHLLVFSRSVYFSVIIMTGLGFGEIAASSTIFMGHIIILIQSLIGYILLGAFLVRIGILFQGEFPVAPVRKRKDPNRYDKPEAKSDTSESDT